MKRTIFKPTKEIDKLATKLVEEHKLACKKANCHCIYSNKTYSESCVKCFALWLLENKVKVEKQAKKR